MRLGEPVMCKISVPQHVTCKKLKDMIKARLFRPKEDPRFRLCSCKLFEGRLPMKIYLDWTILSPDDATLQEQGVKNVKQSYARSVRTILTSIRIPQFVHSQPWPSTSDHSRIQAGKQLRSQARHALAVRMGFGGSECSSRRAIGDATSEHKFNLTQGKVIETQRHCSVMWIVSST
jgi:hypothetical protein